MNTSYWLEKIRDETIANAHIEGAQYVQAMDSKGASSISVSISLTLPDDTELSLSESELEDVVRSEINEIRTMDDSTNQEKDAVTDGEATAEINEEEPWILENGINVTSLFTIYLEPVRQLIEMEGLIHIETHVQELSALNRVLVLKPLQHSEMIREVFTDENIKYITNEQLKTTMDSSLDFTSEELTQLNLVLKHLINQTQSVHSYGIF
ncbi:unnamed protein product [Mucor hiemalis]